MIERLLIVLILTLVGSVVYTAVRQLHMRRLGRKTAGNGRPTLLYFRSEHCAPCVTQSRYLEQVAQKWNGRLAIHKIDADAEPEKAQQFGVFTLPTTILIDKLGAVRQINYGLTNDQKLSQQLNVL